MTGIYAASTALKARFRSIDVISNNLANIGTTAFKRSRAEFTDLLYQPIMAPGQSTSEQTQTPVGQEVGVGTKLSGIMKDFSQGSLTATERDLDVAIDGPGFFEVTGSNGEKLYTRDGSFQRSSEGKIVTSQGLPLSGVQAIPLNARKVNIGSSGFITFIDNTGVEQDLGKIQLVLFQNPSGLSSKGDNLYAETPASGQPNISDPGVEGAGILKQHFLEASNVQIAEEMVKMLNEQRGYEMATKAIKAADEMSATAVQIAR